MPQVGGSQGVFVAGGGGYARGGDGAVAIVLVGGTAQISDGGIAYIERGKAAIVNEQAVAISLVNGSASAGCGSFFVIGFREGNKPDGRINFRIGIIGSKENSTIKVEYDKKPNTLYHLSQTNDLEEMP